MTGLHWEFVKYNSKQYSDKEGQSWEKNMNKKKKRQRAAHVCLSQVTIFIRYMELFVIYLHVIYTELTLLSWVIL